MGQCICQRGGEGLAGSGWPAQLCPAVREDAARGAENIRAQDGAIRYWVLDDFWTAALLSVTFGKHPAYTVPPAAHVFFYQLRDAGLRLLGRFLFSSDHLSALHAGGSFSE